MMTKRFLMLALGAGLAFPVGALAQQTAPPAMQDPGHGEAGHTHKGEADAKPRPNETTSDYLWRKSDQAFHDGDYPRAVSLHNAIVSYDPTDIESYSVASWLLWSMGKADESNAFIERGVKANPQNPEMWDAAGQHYDLQKKFKDSRNAYAKAVELGGPNGDQMVRRRLAHASEKSGDLVASIITWQALVHDFPNEAVNKNNLGRVEALQASKGGTPAAPVAAVAFAALLLPLMAYRRRQSQS